MKKILGILALLLALALPSFAISERNTIQYVYGDGKFIKMLDGSVYRVFDYETFVTALWLPYTDVIITDYEIINIDDDESVGYIKRIK